jgi:hypothetical protein
MKNLSIQMGEFKESIGAAVAPLIQKMLPALLKFSTFAQENTKLIVTLGAVIGTFALAIIGLNAGLAIYNTIQALTLALNTALTASFSALWIATGVVVIIAIIAALVALQVKFNIFGKAIDGIKVGFNAVWGAIKYVFDWAKNNWPLLLAVITGPFGLAIAFVVKFKDNIMDMFSLIYKGIKTYMGFVADVITAPFKAAFRAVASLWNNTIGKLSFKVPGWVPGIGGKGFDVPDIPMLAQGGIVTSPTLAMIAEAGPEAVIPLSKMGGMGGGTNITVNVQGADPNAVVAALQRYVRISGPVPVNIRAM